MKTSQLDEDALKQDILDKIKQTVSINKPSHSIMERIENKDASVTETEIFLVGAEMALATAQAINIVYAQQVSDIRTTIRQKYDKEEADVRIQAADAFANIVLQEVHISIIGEDI